MGIGSSSGARRRHRPFPPPAPQIGGGTYPYPPQYHHQYEYGTNPNPHPHPHHAHFYPYSGFYPPPPNWMPSAESAPHFVEHHKTLNVKNLVNIKKDSLRVEPDDHNPALFLVAFTFDADSPGSITLMFHSEEDADFNLVPAKDSLLKPVQVPFEKGIAQKFRQPCGTGIDFSTLKDIGMTQEGDVQVYPLVVKAEAQGDGSSPLISQITRAVFEKKDNGGYNVRVVKQILCVNDMRYELKEIYGILNAVEDDANSNEAGKECIVCLSEPRDTTLLPCRHMCMCSGCAKVLRFQTNRCPVCRQPVEQLLEIKVNNGADGAVG